MVLEKVVNDVVPTMHCGARAQVFSRVALPDQHFVDPTALRGGPCNGSIRPVQVGLGAAALLLTLFLLLMRWLAEVVHSMQFSISRW